MLEEAVVDDVAYEMLVLLFPESAMAGFDFRYTLPEFRLHVVLVAHVYAPTRMHHEKAPTGPCNSLHDRGQCLVPCIEIVACGHEIRSSSGVDCKFS